MHPIRRALLLASVALAAACSAPNRQAVPLPAPGAPLAGADVGRVHLARAAQTIGAVRGLRVYDGEQFVGTIGRDGYLCWERPAGHRPLVLVYEGPAVDGGDVESVADLDVEAGAEHFLEVHLDPHTKKPRVEVLSAAEGRALLAEREPPRAE